MDLGYAKWKFKLKPNLKNLVQLLNSCKKCFCNMDVSLLLDHKKISSNISKVILKTYCSPCSGIRNITRGQKGNLQ